MKFAAFLLVLSLTVSSLTAELYVSEEEDQDKLTDSRGICHGVEDVDLSEFNLKKDDIKKLALKTIQDRAIQEEVSFEENDSSLKITINENGLGTVRKVVVTPEKTKIYSKTLKTSEVAGTLTTTVSGSIKTGINAESNGDIGFKVDENTFAEKHDSHNTVSGDIVVKSNSTCKLVKKVKVNVLETDSESSSSGKISWEDQDNNENVDTQMESTANSHSGTVFLSKKCLVSKTRSSFETKLSGDTWNTEIQGTGKGGVYSHVFSADKNGSSLSWTFAKFYVPSKLSIMVGNETISGHGFTVVKVFTETITKALPSTSSNSKRIEVSNEIKAKVEAKTSLSKGYTVYATGGQLMFRNTVIELPTEELEGENALENMVYGLITKQGSPDHLLTNSFVNSIMVGYE